MDLLPLLSGIVILIAFELAAVRYGADSRGWR
jgi:hypothetical protein